MCFIILETLIIESIVNMLISFHDFVNTHLKYITIMKTQRTMVTKVPHTFNWTQLKQLFY